MLCLCSLSRSTPLSCILKTPIFAAIVKPGFVSWNSCLKRGNRTSLKQRRHTCEENNVPALHINFIGKGISGKWLASCALSAYTGFGIFWNNLFIFNTLQMLFVTERAKLCPVASLYEKEKMAGHIHETTLGEKDWPAIGWKRRGKLLPIKQGTP